MAADIEAIARAWMAHQGYTDDEVLQAEQQTCQSSGCELQGYDYDCSDEEGKSNHPLADALQPGDGHGYHARKVALPARLLDDGL
jgi:hypothetical protein